MKPLAPNSMIQNRYLIVQAIGKGGMGEVYLAVDQRLGSAVALKRTYFADDSALGAAFEREARILGRLRHPVLPKVIDHFVENGDQYLVMEHISGDDLSKRLEAAKKPFPLSWVMFWADQLLDALTYLHSHEPPIIHRDIKPQNLKLTDENHIVLLDFGLSKDFDSKSAANPMNSASVAGYSPHFASMEQIRGTGTDGRSDLFSLAATLYQVLTDSVPVDALSRADSLLGGKPDPIEKISDLNPEVPEDISDVLIHGMAVRQEERFSSAAEMQRALRRAFNSGRHTLEKTSRMPVADPPVIMSTPANIEADAAEKTEADAVEQKATTAAPTGSLEKTVAIGRHDGDRALNTKPSETRTEVFDKAEIAAAAEKTSAVGDLADDRATRPSIPAPVIAAAPKPGRSGGSKAVAIVGLIVAIAVIGIAGVGGYFAYTRYRKTVVKLEPSPVAEPSPSASPVSVADSSTPPEPANSNSAAPTDSNSTVSNAEPVSNTPTTTPAKPTPQATKAITVKTPAAAKPTTGKKSDDRTVILQ